MKFSKDYIAGYFDRCLRSRHFLVGYNEFYKLTKDNEILILQTDTDKNNRAVITNKEMIVNKVYEHQGSYSRSYDYDVEELIVEYLDEGRSPFLRNFPTELDINNV